MSHAPPGRRFIRQGPLLPLAVVAAALVIAALGPTVVTVGPQEQGVLVRGGVPQAVLLEPGLHVLPDGWWSQVVVVETRTLRTMPVGFRLVDSVRGVRPTPDQVEWLVGGDEIVRLEALVSYQVTDPVTYVAATREPDEAVRRLAESNVTRLLAGRGVDALLGDGRGAVQEDLRRMLQDDLERLGVGLTAVSVSLREVSPPQEVLRHFQAVVDAGNERQRSVTEAHNEARRIVAESRADATKRRADTDSAAVRQVAAAQADAERWRLLLAEWEQEPATFRQRAYFDTITTVLGRTRTYVLDTANPHAASLTLLPPPPRR